ncbi:MAG: hypothetical protein J3K34DRAFT_518693 [Monoraphidium minutum]|nr:MAG: hypothetical protein J3K34DRAFT_518693 [Monoraphidium minutum]
MDCTDTALDCRLRAAGPHGMSSAAPLLHAALEATQPPPPPAARHRQQPQHGPVHGGGRDGDARRGGGAQPPERRGWRFNPFSILDSDLRARRQGTLHDAAAKGLAAAAAAALPGGAAAAGAASAAGDDRDARAPTPAAFAVMIHH